MFRTYPLGVTGPRSQPTTLLGAIRRAELASRTGGQPQPRPVPPIFHKAR